MDVFMFHRSLGEGSLIEGGGGGSLKNQTYKRGAS